MKKYKNGWTFIETLIVICIIGLVAVLIIPIFYKDKIKKKSSKNESKILVESYGSSFDICTITIDGCEYIYIYNAPINIIHKGNCKNSIHWQK